MGLYFKAQRIVEISEQQYEALNENEKQQLISLSEDETNFYFRNKTDDYTPNYREVKCLLLNNNNPDYLSSLRKRELQRITNRHIYMRESAIPRYRFENALAGVYKTHENEEIIGRYKEIVSKLRKDYEKKEAYLNTAATVAEIKAVLSINSIKQEEL